MTPALLAALAAAVAVVAGWPAADHRLVRRLAVLPAGLGSARPRGWGAALVGLSAGAVVLAGVVGGRRGVTLALAALIAGAAWWWLAARARVRKGAADARRQVARAGESLGGLLRVGAIPASALTVLAPDHPVLTEAAALQAVGGDVVVALRRGSAAPGLGGLASLAAAWEVSCVSGASMERSIDAIAADLHRREETATTVAVELAAARSAGRLLACLPIAGVLLGYGFGGDPLGFLADNPVGEVCLVLAVALAGGGLLWTDSLADRAAS